MRRSRGRSVKVCEAEANETSETCEASESSGSDSRSRASKASRDSVSDGKDSSFPSELPGLRGLDVKDVDALPKGCEVRMGGAHGASLVATRTFLAGQAVLVERVLASLDSTCLSSIWASALDLLCDTPASVREQAFKLYTPEGSNAAAGYLKAMEEDGHEFPDLDHRMLLRALLCLHFNSLRCDEGHLLYATACRMNHSCVPNCRVEVDGDDSRLRVTCVADVGLDEELTISYYGINFGLKLDTKERRARLLGHFEFECRCDLCEGVSDRSEVLRRSMVKRSAEPRRRRHRERQSQ